MSTLPLAALAAVLLAAAAGCIGADDASEAADEDTAPSPATAELDDLVSLTVYLRTGGSEDDLLQPVTREVPIGDDLPSRAVQLLLDGPEGAGEEGLESPWPEGTELNGVTVAGGTATVDLTGEVLDDPPEPDRAPHLEALALASLANTLTEFPAVEQVEVTVDGDGAATESVEEFWGGWGLPESLTRDVTLVVDGSDEDPPSLDSFETGRQTVGSRDAEPVTVQSVRVRDRITYLRVVVEVADAEDPNGSASAFPRTYSRSDAGEVVLEITGVAALDEGAVPAGLDEQVAPVFDDLEVGEGARANSMRLTLQPQFQRAHRVYLHTSTSPSRIVLDVKK